MEAPESQNEAPGGQNGSPEGQNEAPEGQNEARTRKAGYPPGRQEAPKLPQGAVEGRSCEGGR